LSAGCACFDPEAVRCRKEERVIDVEHLIVIDAGDAEQLAALGIVCAVGAGKRQQGVEDHRGRAPVYRSNHGAAGQVSVGDDHLAADPAEPEWQAVARTEQRARHLVTLVVEVRIAMPALDAGEQTRQRKILRGQRVGSAPFIGEATELRLHLPGCVVPQQAGMEQRVGAADDVHIIGRRAAQSGGSKGRHPACEHRPPRESQRAGFTNLSVIRSDSPIARYFARSVSPSARRGGRVQTPLG